ncbi:MAG: GIY-YIG nuclease family protein [Bacillota bacterium]|nr:GIY-YIG nuclease family protein [Bacillota bacterium]
MPYVYMLRCCDDTYYTGYTVNIERRLQQHQQGIASRYTRGRCPVELIYLETCPSKSAALKREAAIKKLTKPQKTSLIQQFHTFWGQTPYVT